MWGKNRLHPTALAALFCACATSAFAPAPAFADEILHHSHNDYERHLPLFDALTHEMNSVEADVWLKSGKLILSHYGFSYRGTLEEVYLEPLQERVDRLGSVRGDGKPFYLWIDLKDKSWALRQRLHQTLGSYPMVTRFYRNLTLPGALIVILTGDENSKRRYFEEHTTWYAVRDSNVFSSMDPPVDAIWTWYALRWSNLFRWNGRGMISSRERARLRRLVRDVQEKGRRLRFWDTPDRSGFWQTMMEEGVDTLGTDSPEKLACFRGLPSCRFQIIE